MSRSNSDDFFSRSKRFLLEAAIFILFSVSLIDFVLTKLSPYLAKIRELLQ